MPREEDTSNIFKRKNNKKSIKWKSQNGKKENKNRKEEKLYSNHMNSKESKEINIGKNKRKKTMKLNNGLGYSKDKDLST